MIENDEQRAITAQWVEKFIESAEIVTNMATTGGEDQRWAENLIASYRGMAQTLEEEIIDYDERKTRLAVEAPSR